VAYFAISTDKPETNQRFAESLDADYPILSDPSKAVSKAYGVVGGLNPFASRWTFFIGADGRILAIDKSVKTASHGGDVAAQLQALGVPGRA
jgi:thioredoxin-dependent peroxiredoxin